MNSEKIMLRTVKTELGDIQYELTRKKVKNLNLRVTSEGVIKVSLPYRLSCEKADDFVIRNAEFVFRSLEKVKRKDEKKNNAAYYLGQKLEVSIIDGAKTTASVNGCALILTIPKISIMNEEEKEEAVQKAIGLWKKEEGKKLFPTILQKGYERFFALGLDVPFPKLSIKVMKSRWGSCTAGKGKICLNALLVEKPLICTEYVVCHELAHFLVQNHSADFYKVLGTVFPRYKEVRNLLNNK